MQYAKNSSGKFNLMPYTIGAASLMGTVGGIGMFMEQAVAQNAIGLIGCGVVVAMLGGPLQVFKEVVRTKSTKDLPLPMAIGNGCKLVRVGSVLDLWSCTMLTSGLLISSVLLLVSRSSP